MRSAISRLRKFLDCTEHIHRHQHFKVADFTRFSYTVDLIYRNLEYPGAPIIRLQFLRTLFTAHHSFLQQMVVLLLHMLGSDDYVKQSDERKRLVMSLEDKLAVLK